MPDDPEKYPNDMISDKTKDLVQSDAKRRIRSIDYDVEIKSQAYLSLQPGEIILDWRQAGPVPLKELQIESTSKTYIFTIQRKDGTTYEMITDMQLCKIATIGEDQKINVAEEYLEKFKKEVGKKVTSKDLQNLEQEEYYLDKDEDGKAVAVTKEEKEQKEEEREAKHGTTKEGREKRGKLLMQVGIDFPKAFLETIPQNVGVTAKDYSKGTLNFYEYGYCTITVDGVESDLISPQLANEVVYGANAQKTSLVQDPKLKWNAILSGKAGNGKHKNLIVINGGEDGREPKMLVYVEPDGNVKTAVIDKDSPEEMELLDSDIVYSSRVEIGNKVVDVKDNERLRELAKLLEEKEKLERVIEIYKTLEDVKERGQDATKPFTYGAAAFAGTVMLPKVAQAKVTIRAVREGAREAKVNYEELTQELQNTLDTEMKEIGYKPEELEALLKKHNSLEQGIGELTLHSDREANL